MPSYTLALDNIPIAGYNDRVTAKLPIPERDLSGDSSSSAVAETGVKPTRLSVSLKIRYVDKADLTVLVNLSRATTDTGARKVYNIINQTAAAYKVKQVRFGGDVTAAELSNEQAWNVTFTLMEHNSVAEKAEQQTEAVTKTKNVNGNNTVTTTEGEQEQLSYFEQKLIALDKWIGEDEYNASALNNMEDARESN